MKKYYNLVSWLSVGTSDNMWGLKLKVAFSICDYQSSFKVFVFIILFLLYIYEWLDQYVQTHVITYFVDEN